MCSLYPCAHPAMGKGICHTVFRMLPGGVNLCIHGPNENKKKPAGKINIPAGYF